MNTYKVIVSTVGNKMKDKVCLVKAETPDFAKNKALNSMVNKYAKSSPELRFVVRANMTSLL